MAHQEAHKAEVCVAVAEAAQVKDPQEGLTPLRYLCNPLLQQVRTQFLTFIQWPLTCTAIFFTLSSKWSSKEGVFFSFITSRGREQAQA